MKYVFTLFILLGTHIALAQSIIHGVLIDRQNDSTIAHANCRNINTLKGMTTTSDGTFTLEVKKNDLIEISKVGYTTIRIRIQNPNEPSYYKLILEKAPIYLKEVDIKGKPLDFKSDSIRYRQTYDIVLRKERKEDIDFKNMPLAMLSKKNRQEWAFQEMFEQLEQEKYIDFVFNKKLIQRITYLEGKELQRFQDMFRPSYEFIRNSSDYEFLSYIKYCYSIFKSK
ncbi:MAG: carboxypeptidase-like regulatory domain-containing protein [Chitinophagaceae bacterium]